MNEIGNRIKRNRLAVAGGVILFHLFGAAILADFVAPYSPRTEFRDHFFHPPSRVHFRNEKGGLVPPYVAQTYVTDSRKHIFDEGSPLWVGRVIPDRNQSPYIAERIEEDLPFAIVRGEGGQVLGQVFTATETGDNTGVFSAQVTIDPHHAGNKFVIQSHGKKAEFVLRDTRYIASTQDPELMLLNESGEIITEYSVVMKKFEIRLFTRGTPHRVFGIFSTDVHLFGVESPGRIFLMGTDQTGRDIFSRVLYGARVSLTVGLLGVLISTLFGLWIGAIAGYFGGKTDSILMRFADVLLSIPALYLILCVRNVFPISMPAEATYLLMIAVLSLTGWAAMARVIRGMVLSLREQEYVLAARALGASSTEILLRHILPNTFGYLIVRASLLIPAYILAEVTLSYLGIGIQEPAPSWGNMLTAAQELRVLEQFWWVLTPGFFLFLTVLGFNFLGEGLRNSTAGMNTKS